VILLYLTSTLNDYNIDLIMSCEVLHYDIPADVELSVLEVILIAATYYQINEFELLLR